MSNKTHYIYALIEPDTGEVRYIGRTTNPDHRLVCHMSHNGGANPQKYDWALELKAKGQTAGLVVLQECDSLESAKAAELAWINKYAPSGALLNKTYKGCVGINKGRRYGHRYFGR